MPRRRIARSRRNFGGAAHPRPPPLQGQLHRPWNHSQCRFRTRPCRCQCHNRCCRGSWRCRQWMPLDSLESCRNFMQVPSKRENTKHGFCLPVFWSPIGISQWMMYYIDNIVMYCNLKNCLPKLATPNHVQIHPVSQPLGMLRHSSKASCHSQSPLWCLHRHHRRSRPQHLQLWQIFLVELLLCSSWMLTMQSHWWKTICGYWGRELYLILCFIILILFSVNCSFNHSDYVYDS